MRIRRHARAGGRASSQGETRGIVASLVLTLLLLAALAATARARIPEQNGAGGEAGLHLGPDDRPAELRSVPMPPAVREGLKLRPDALRALVSMVDAAQEAGVELRVVSAYRSYQYQRGLYRSAVRRYGPDQGWVAAPGTSEHQLGTAVDLADAKLAHVLDASFGACPEGRWVREHAHEFGFTLSYTAANAAITGIEPEPWHLRYRPTSPSSPRAAGAPPDSP